MTSKKTLGFTPETLLAKLADIGDATIDYINSAGKSRYAVVTIDFSTPYVLAKVLEKSMVTLIEDDFLTVFSWDADKLIRIPASKVVHIVPLSQTLNGTRVR